MGSRVLHLRFWDLGVLSTFYRFLVGCCFCFFLFLFFGMRHTRAGRSTCSKGNKRGPGGLLYISYKKNRKQNYNFVFHVARIPPGSIAGGCPVALFLQLDK